MKPKTPPIPTVWALILSKILIKNAKNKPMEEPKMALLKEAGIWDYPLSF